MGEDVLAAPADAVDARAAQETRELTRRALGRESGTQQFRAGDDATADETVERACDEFDFGQFGHDG
jgi:hypothetical protein